MGASMLKKFSFLLFLFLTSLLVACNVGGTDTTTTAQTGYEGTYTGTISGLNAGPATIVVSATNAVTGNWTITNRVGGPYYAGFKGTIDASTGKLTADAYHIQSGTVTMYFKGQISSSGALTGTWGEYIHGNVEDGAFSLQRPSTSTSTPTTGSPYQGVYVTTIARHPDVAPGAGYLAGVANFKVNADGTVSNETAAEGSVILHGYRSEIGAGSRVDANGNFNLNFNVIGTSTTGATASGTISSTGVVSGNAYEAGHANPVGLMTGKRAGT
jgi:hypothetical protein